MKYLIAFLLVSGLFSCHNSGNEFNPTNKFIVPIVIDDSGTRIGMDFMDTTFFRKAVSVAVESHAEVEFRVQNIANSYPKPCFCTIKAKMDNSDPYDQDYKKKEMMNAKVEMQNEQQVKNFFNCLEPMLSRSPRNVKDDFSYVNRHLRSVAFSLRESSAKNIALFSTDFKDDHPKKGESDLDPKVIEALKAVVDQGGSIYVENLNEQTIDTANKFGGHSIGHHNDFIQILENTLKNNKKY